MSVSEWYDYRKLNSYNAIWSIVSGPRSIGKTYGAKRDAVKDAIKDGTETLWVRRNLTELAPAKHDFFGAVAGMYPGYDFRLSGDAAQVRTDGNDWQNVVRFVGLTVAHQIKGTEYPRVAKIVYDECFTVPGTPYLSEELARLRELLVTINRSRVSERTGIAQTKMLMLGNVRELDNPYFLEWDFGAEREWQKAAGGDVILHLVDASKYVKRVTKSIYGNVLGTEQLDYAEGSYFLPDGGYVIPERPANSTPFATLVTLNKGTYGLWLAPDYSAMFVTVGPLAAEVSVVAFEPMAVHPGIVLADNNSFIRKETRRHYRRGSMFLVTPGAYGARQALAR